MQHFSQIWDSTLSLSSSVQAGLGFLAGLGSYIPRPFSSQSHGPAPLVGKNGSAGDGGEEKNPSEQLDDMLRQSIYAFTNRWGGMIHDAKVKKPTAKPLAKVEKELEDILDRAFANQPEVVGKLKEAVWASAEALEREGRDARKRGGR
jgi:hypothetical protein